MGNEKNIFHGKKLKEALSLYINALFGLKTPFIDSLKHLENLTCFQKPEDCVFIQIIDSGFSS